MSKRSAPDDGLSIPFRPKPSPATEAPPPTASSQPAQSGAQIDDDGDDSNSPASGLHREPDGITDITKGELARLMRGPISEFNKLSFAKKLGFAALARTDELQRGGGGYCKVRSNGPDGEEIWFDMHALRFHTRAQALKHLGAEKNDGWLIQEGGKFKVHALTQEVAWVKEPAWDDVMDMDEFVQSARKYLGPNAQNLATTQDLCDAYRALSPADFNCTTVMNEQHAFLGYLLGADKRISPILSHRNTRFLVLWMMLEEDEPDTWHLFSLALKERLNACNAGKLGSLKHHKTYFYAWRDGSETIPSLSSKQRNKLRQVYRDLKSKDLSEGASEKAKTGKKLLMNLINPSFCSSASPLGKPFHEKIAFTEEVLVTAGKPNTGLERIDAVLFEQVVADVTSERGFENLYDIFDGYGFLRDAVLDLRFP